MGLLIFAAAYLAALLVASAVAVYGFGRFEPAWGPGNSLQVMAWVAAVAAFVAVISFGLASAMRGRFAGNRACLALGAASALVGLGILFTCTVLVGRPTLPAALLAAVAPAILVALLPGRHIRPAPAPAIGTRPGHPQLDPGA